MRNVAEAAGHWRSSMEELSAGTIREDRWDGDNDLSSVDVKVLFPTPQPAANAISLPKESDEPDWRTTP